MTTPRWSVALAIGLIGGSLSGVTLDGTRVLPARVRVKYTT